MVDAQGAQCGAAGVVRWRLAAIAHGPDEAAQGLEPRGLAHDNLHTGHPRYAFGRPDKWDRRGSS